MRRLPRSPLFPYTTLFRSWVTGLGLDVPGGSREFLGFRYALIAAVVGGARVLYGSLESLFEGRLGADLALAIACIAAILISEDRKSTRLNSSHGYISYAVF